MSRMTMLNNVIIVLDTSNYTRLLFLTPERHDRGFYQPSQSIELKEEHCIKRLRDLLNQAYPCEPLKTN